jgi:hypothetical protein
MFETHPVMPVSPEPQQEACLRNPKSFTEPNIKIDDLIKENSFAHRSETVKVSNRMSTMLYSHEDPGSDDDRMDYMMAHLESHQSNYISRS